MHSDILTGSALPPSIAEHGLRTDIHAITVSVTLAFIYRYHLHGRRYLLRIIEPHHAGPSADRIRRVHNPSQGQPERSTMRAARKQSRRHGTAPLEPGAYRRVPADHIRRAPAGCTRKTGENDLPSRVDYTQPVGLGRPAILQACFAGPPG